MRLAVVEGEHVRPPRHGPRALDTERLGRRSQIHHLGDRGGGSRGQSRAVVDVERSASLGSGVGLVDHPDLVARDPVTVSFRSPGARGPRWRDQQQQQEREPAPRREPAQDEDRGQDRSQDRGDRLQARFRSAGRMGSERSRLPVAAKIAFAIAGASGGTPGSPTPPICAPLSMMCTSTSGISFMRTTG